MNRFTTIFALLFLFASVALSQTWTKNNNVTEGNYTSVSFKNDSTGIFTTKAGDVFSTTNGGASFSSITPLPKSLINAVCINGTSLWVVGGNKELNSTDWGATWFNFAIFNPISLSNVTDVVSVGDSTWFVGIDTIYSGIIRMRHSGNTYEWSSSQFPLNKPIQKADYLLGRLWAYGANDSIYSSSGNNPWNKYLIDTTVTSVVSMFTDTSNTLFALTQNSANSGLYKSYDTGKTWNKTPVIGKVYAGTIMKEQIFISVLDGIPKILSWLNNTWQNPYVTDSVVVNFATTPNSVWAVGASGVYQYKPRTINHPPILQKPGLNLSMTVNKIRRDTLIATDEDGDVVKYHQYLSNYAWITTDSLTGVRTFSPTVTDTGRYLILFQAYDGYGGTDQVLDTFQIYPNRPPVITNSSNTDTLQLNAIFRDTLQYLDLDGDICTWSVPEKPSSMIASVDNQTLQLYWSANTVGTFNVRTMIDDSHGGTDTWLKKLVVVQSNRIPVIDTTHLPRTARVGVNYSGYIPWSDPDGDRVFFTLTAGPSWLSITDSGRLYNNRSLYQSDIGNKLITINYTDNNGGNGLFSYWLKVEIFYPPVIAGISGQDTTATPGHIYEVQPTLIDSGNGKLQWYFIANDHQADFLTININTGLISGTPSSPGRYKVILHVVDSLGLTDQLQYWLRVASPNGIFDPNIIPTEFALYQNYPNPFNPSTIITYDLPEATTLNIKIFNMLGQEVATLVDGMKNAGRYTAIFQAENIPAGVYLYQVKTPAWTQTKKMILTK